MTNRLRWGKSKAESPSGDSGGEEGPDSGPFSRFSLQADSLPEPHPRPVTPKSARTNHRTSWKTDAPAVILEDDLTPRTAQTRTHDVRRALSELQGEYAKQGELLKKTLNTLKAKDRDVKRLEAENQELITELRDLTTKLLDSQQEPGLMQEQLLNQKAQLVALKAQLEDRNTAQWTKFQAELAAKDQELASVKEAAERTELETKQRMEKEMDRLCSILAQSSEKLTALQQHLKHTDCVCREGQQEAASLGSTLPEVVAALREDILFVKFELEGLHKVFCDLGEGGKFPVVALLNRTFVVRPRESFGLAQCVEGVQEIKKVLLRTKEAVAKLYAG